MTAWSCYFCSFVQHNQSCPMIGSCLLHVWKPRGLARSLECFHSFPVLVLLWTNPVTIQSNTAIDYLSGTSTSQLRIIFI